MGEIQGKLTVQNFIDIKDNAGAKVIINKAFGRDTCDPLREELWRGCIEDIPEEHRPLEVLETGWSLSQQMPVLTVIWGRNRKETDANDGKCEQRKSPEPTKAIRAKSIISR